jgi:cytochrome c5
MKKLTLAATAIAVAAALAGCGRNDDTANTASTAASPIGSTAPSSTTASVPPSTGADGSSSSTTAAAPATSPADGSGTTAAAPSTSPADSSGSTVASSASGTSADASASNTAAMGAGSTAAMGAGGSGQTVYTSTCAMCHAAGVAGAPKPGDKAEWQPRIAQGKDTLYTHALKGFTGKKGTMPPKGGNTSVPDADVKAAVDYMVGQSK